MTFELWACGIALVVALVIIGVFIAYDIEIPPSR